MRLEYYEFMARTNSRNTRAMSFERKKTPQWPQPPQGIHGVGASAPLAELSVNHLP